MGGRTASIIGRRALAAPLNAAGGALAFTGRLRAAQRCFELALRLVGRGQSVTVLRAAILNRLGVVEKTAGHYDRAAGHYHEAEVLMQLVGATSPLFEAVMEHNRAGLLLAQGDAKRAEVHARRAVDLRRREGAPAVDLATDQIVVAVTVATQGRADEARTQFAEALSTLESGLGPNHYEVGSALVGLGVLEQQQNPCLAEQHYKRALAIKQRTRGPGHPEVGIVHNNLGALYRAQGRDQLARDHFLEAAPRLRRYGPDHPAMRTCQANIAKLAERG